MKTYTLHTYKAADGWRWRLQARNGRIVADSGEAYTRRTGAERAGAALAGAVIVVAKSKPAIYKVIA